jgi:hypothetical protein
MTWLKNYHQVFKIMGILTIIMIFATSGFATDQIKGDIVAAEKYSVEQISEADVQLENPEYYAMLQDDQVLDMINNNTYRHSTTQCENALLAPRPQRLSPYSIEMQSFLLRPPPHRLSTYSVEMQSFLLAPRPQRLSPYSIEMQSFLLAPRPQRLSPYSIEMQSFLLTPGEPELSPYEVDFQSLRMVGDMNVMIHN